MWKHRNGVVHEGRSVEIEGIFRELLARGRKHGAFRKPYEIIFRPNPRGVWTNPPKGYIKINTNATVGKSVSCVAVVVKNWRGTVVLALSKKVNTTIPLQPEAEALFWASQLAVELGVDDVIFESESKECIHSLNNPHVLAPWRIRNSL